MATRYCVLTPAQEAAISDAIRQARMCLMCVDISSTHKESAIKALRTAADLMKKKQKKLEATQNGNRR